MNSGFYNFRLGAFECVSLLDGSMDYPIQNIYSNVPREHVEEALHRRRLPVEVVTTPYTYPWVNTGAHRVLVDNGAGDLGPKTGRLLDSMRSAGISPAGVDALVISHAHPDHIGGTLDERGRPIYPNAYYYIWKEEWNFWFSEAASARTNEHFVAIARKNLEPIKERVILIDHEAEILPGVSVMPAPGHTPGHMVVTFQSGGQSLLYIADTVIQPLHLEYPGWLPVYDILPEKAAESKQRVFDRAAETHALVLGQHFPPFPSLGTIRKQGQGWLWEPIAIQQPLEQA
jgi:glyoxylase-like metal-dependent hydrolase (beta-lactamase superfamily II)